jgi:hypothetical membrane protein
VVTVRGVPWWGLVSATASPVLLIGGWTVAAGLQPPGFSPMADTVSALAAIGATDRWFMSLVFVVVGVCDIVTGLALRPARLAGRLILIAGAIAGILVAAYPEHPGSGSVPHTLWASLGFAGLSAWPAWAYRRGPDTPWALQRAPAYSIVAVQFLLLIWFVVELIVTGGQGGQVGLAERLVGGTQAAWPLVVVLSCLTSPRPHSKIENTLLS